ncbi:MAG: AMP-binding protein [Alphaproteobacteria bacterium]|nr:AMP-binding protein [Alphaproteobacteria bacterium]
MKLKADKTNLALVRKFEDTAESFSEKTAVIHNHTPISYKELNERANKLARLLNDKNQSNHVIGISGTDKFNMLIGQLAILKINSTFVVLNDKDPEKRTNFIIKDSNISMVLYCDSEKTSQSLKDLEQIKIPEIDLSHYSNNNINYTTTAPSPAYLLYTSGSTGNNPKGVIQTQENIVHQIERYTRDLKIGATDSLFQLATFAHDQAIVDIYGALLNGATLVLHESLLDRNAILSSINDNKVTIFSSIPSMFSLIFEDASGSFPPYLRVITIGGEETTLEHAKLFQKIASPHCELINGYGATECSWVSSYTITTETDLHRFTSFPLGAITEGLDYLIDGSGNYPEGGELLISGPGVSPGYHNNDKENKKSFTIKEGKTYYKTGDIVEKSKSAEDLQFIGRATWHEKIRGKRVNIKGIEDLLTEKLKTRCFVIAVGTGIDKKLIALYHNKENIEITNDYLLGELSGMMVSDVIPISDIPCLANGKVNRNALKEAIPQKYLSKTPSGLVKNDDHYNSLETIGDLIEKSWKNMFGDANPEIFNRTFLQLGGNSLQAMQLKNVLSTYYEKTFFQAIDIPLSIIYNSNIDDLIFQIRKLFVICDIESNDPIIQKVSIQLPYFEVSGLYAECFESKNVHSLIMNDASLLILVEYYNKKYNINICHCLSSEDFINKIYKFSKTDKSLQVGLTFPVTNIANAHPVSCILSVKEGSIKLLFSNSAGNDNHYHEKIMGIVYEMKDTAPEVYELFNKIQFVKGNIIRQDDFVSCSLDAILFLKNALSHGVVHDRIISDDEGNVTNLPPEFLKTAQADLPQYVSCDQSFNGKEGKNLNTHLLKHSRNIVFEPVNKSSINKPLTIESKCYLYNKVGKFVSIINEAFQSKNDPNVSKIQR